MALTGVRRRARETALQILYFLDANEGDGARLGVEEASRRYYASFLEELPLADGEGREYADELVRGVWERREEVDAAVQRSSRNWRVERMARVDRNILRLATYEVLFSKDVPAKAVLNEAIEIAKRFGTADSPAFVNGVLDKLKDRRAK